MERFEVPTVRPTSTAPPQTAGRALRRDAAVAAPPAVRAGEVTSVIDPEPGAARTLPPAPSYAGLVGLGAVAGSAIAVSVGSFAGWSGPSLSVAALVGVDIGLLVGAGAGGLLVRRHRRGHGAPPRRPRLVRST